MSRRTGNVDIWSLRPLRKEAWKEFYEGRGVTKARQKKKKGWYQREFKAVKVTLSWECGEFVY